VLRRVRLLVVALFLVPSLIARPGVSFFEHDHDGGSDPHDHHALAGHVHDGHSHPDDTEEEPIGEDPDDDHHGHFRASHVDALHRLTLSDGLPAPAATPHHAPCGIAACTSLAETRRLDGVATGPPRSGPDRTLDRLVRGLGLRI
jgi:hypothetical protein